MSRLLAQFGACDCHSHVFGPFKDFPLSPARTFDPCESPIEKLEEVWRAAGLDRAVLVQGSAHGSDHSAMIAAIMRSPETRRGVAVLNASTPFSTIHTLHNVGVRAVRLNWMSHLFGSDQRTDGERLLDAAELLARVSPLGWHVEVHLDISEIGVCERLCIPSGMIVVVDHMARMDVAAEDAACQLAKLSKLLESETFWVKLSGADRLALQANELRDVTAAMRRLIAVAPDRCVWGLDWPHVNLPKRRSDAELVDLLVEVAGDEATLERILIHNPATLYGFPRGGRHETSSFSGENERWSHLKTEEGVAQALRKHGRAGASLGVLYPRGFGARRPERAQFQTEDEGVPALSSAGYGCAAVSASRSWKQKD